MQVGKKGIYVMESLVISYIVTGIFFMCACVCDVSNEIGNKDRGHRCNSDLYFGFHDCRVDCRKKDWKKKVFVGAGSRTAVFSNPFSCLYGNSLRRNDGIR